MKNKIITKLKSIKWPIYALTLLSAIAMALPFIFKGLSWISFLSVVPFFYFIDYLQRQKTSGKVLINKIWLVGFLFFILVMLWFTQINAMSLLSDPLTRMIFIPLTIGFFVGVFSIGFLFLGWIIVKLKIDLSKQVSFILIPSAWAIGEFIRSVLFSIISLGEGGVVGPHWNFGVLGFSISDTPLIYASRILGLYGTSFLIVLINLCLFQIIFGKLKKQAGYVLILSLSIPLVGYLAYSNGGNSKEDKVGVIHLSQYIQTDYQKPVLDSIKSINEPRASVVFLPEYSNFLEEERSLELDKEIATKVTKPDSEDIITTRSEKASKYHANDTVLMDAQGEVKERRGKTFLIPGGEFVPYLYKAILIASANPETVIEHEEGESVKQSTDPVQPFSINGIRYGVLACSGAIAPEFYRDITAKNSEVLVNVASLSSMGLDGIYFNQAMQMAKFNAVANDRYYIQSSRGKDSYIMDNNGKILTRNANSESSYFTGVVKTRNTKTPYTLFGEIMLLISGLMLMSYAIANRKKLNLLKKNKKLSKKV